MTIAKGNTQSTVELMKKQRIKTKINCKCKIKLLGQKMWKGKKDVEHGKEAKKRKHFQT